VARCGEVSGAPMANRGQVRVGDEELAVGNEVRLVPVDARGAGGGCVAARRDNRAREQRPEVPAAQDGGLSAGWIRQGPVHAGLDDVQVADTPGIEVTSGPAEGSHRIGVGHPVRWAEWGDPEGATAIRRFTIPITPEAELEALRARHGHPLARPRTTPAHPPGEITTQAGPKIRDENQASRGQFR
jgi:hypothetical protein